MLVNSLRKQGTWERHAHRIRQTSKTYNLVVDIRHSRDHVMQNFYERIILKWKEAVKTLLDSSDGFQ